MSEAPSRRSFLVSMSAAAGSAALPSSATATEQRQVEIDRADYPEEDVTEVRITGPVGGVYEDILDIFDEEYANFGPSPAWPIIQRGDIEQVRLGAIDFEKLEVGQSGLTELVVGDLTERQLRIIEDEDGDPTLNISWPFTEDDRAGAFHDDAAGEVAHYLRENVDEVEGHLIQSVEVTPSELVVEEILFEHTKRGQYE